MRKYPIGSFLVWKVNQENRRKYQFYQFLSNYHERDQRRNEPFRPVDETGVTVILDGQQRLTSLYIGLAGSYTAKIKHKRRNNPDAYPRKHLYLDILRPASGEEIGPSYNFRFLADTEVNNQNGAHWFRVSEILTFKDLTDVMDYLRLHKIFEIKYPQTCLCNLFKAVCDDPLINYYQEEDQDLDKV